MFSTRLQGTLQRLSLCVEHHRQQSGPAFNSSSSLNLSCWLLSLFQTARWLRTAISGQISHTFTGLGQSSPGRASLCPARYLNTVAFTAQHSENIIHAVWQHKKNLLKKGNYCAELESWICSAEFFSRARESGCDIAHKQCPAILSTSAELPINMWHIQINSSVMSSWILIWFQKQLKSYCEHLSMYQAVDEVTASLGAVLLHSV